MTSDLKQRWKTEKKKATFKNMKYPIHLLTMVFASMTVWLPALSIEDLQFSYEAAVLEANEGRDKQLGTLNQRYLTALSKLQKQAQKQGTLDKAVAIKNEGILIEEKTWPMPPVPKTASKTLQGPRRTYLKARFSIEKDWALKTVMLADKMEKALKEKILSLTKSGNLEEAQGAQVLLKKIQEDPDLANARELPSRVMQSGKSRAGLIVRRNGDNLEVMVRYDSEGKISLKSPVENVVEQTGGKREKGKTSARTLGEFVGVGAEDTERFIALDYTPEDGKLTPDELIGVDVNFQNDEGTSYKIRTGSKNAYLGFSNLLGTLSSPATYRIIGELKIPKGNNTLSGLFFKHGNSNGTIIGEQIIGSGNWETVIREGPGGSILPLFRIHFSGFKLSTINRAWGDEFVLKNLRIEFIKFSAHIVEQYGDSGEVIIAEKNPLRQRLLVTNGVLAEGL
jgi:hypothetical protein